MTLSKRSHHGGKDKCVKIITNWTSANALTFLRGDCKRNIVADAVLDVLGARGPSPTIGQRMENSIIYK